MKQPHPIETVEKIRMFTVALLRFVSIITMVGIGTVLVVLTAPLPGLYNGSPICAWILTHMCRMALFIVCK